MGAQCRTVREEQNDESEEFLAIFDGSIDYIEGGRTASGFFTIDEVDYLVRLYRVHGKGSSIILDPVPLDIESLDPRFVFVLDGGLKLFVWFGKKSKNTLRSKARLMAEKIKKEERKNMSEISVFSEGQELPAFWSLLNYSPPEVVEGEPPTPLVHKVSQNIAIKTLYFFKLFTSQF